MQLIQRGLELGILFDVGLEGIGFLRMDVDGEVAGHGVPLGLVFGVDAELDELKRRGFLGFVAALDHPQGAAAGGNAALIVRVYIGEVSGAHFKVGAHVGQNARQVGGGGQEDRRVAGNEGRAGRAGAAALHIIGGLGLGDLLPHVEDIQRCAVFTEHHLGGVAGAAVAVVDIFSAHLANPLLEEPAVVGEDEAVALDAAVGVLDGQLIGDFQDAVHGGGNFGDAGLVEGGLVVIHQGRGAVEGHGVDLAVNRVVRQEVGLDGAGVPIVLVDVFLHGHDPAAVDDEAGADLIGMHDVAGQLAHAGGLELVDGVVVGALILRVHEDLILRFVKVIHDLLDALGVCALQRIPEDNGGLFLGGGEGCQGQQHRKAQKHGYEFLHWMESSLDIFYIERPVPDARIDGKISP